MIDKSSPMLSNRAYDILKYVAQILLPALGALYFALSQTWGISHGPEVVGSITAFDTFLGLLLGLSARSYVATGAKYDGSLDVLSSGDSRTFSLNLDTHPDDLQSKDEVTFKVNNQVDDSPPAPPAV